MALYPTDVDQPRAHVAWAKTITLGTGKVVILAGYKVYHGMPGERGYAAQHSALASVTVSTYDDVTKPNNYTGAILAEKQFRSNDVTQCEVQALNWLAELGRESKGLNQ